MNSSRFKRVLLKLSGEALTSSNSFGIDPKAVTPMLTSIATIVKQGVEVAIVIGGGNFIRGGKANFSNSIRRSTADQMGMLATMINAIALRDMLISTGVKSEALSARFVDGVLATATTQKAQTLLSSGTVVVFAGGTGNPFVTTDSAASLRAIEIEAEVLLKATTVDGVYNLDPNKNKNAKKYDTITFDEVLQKELAVMDLGAFVQCRDFNIPICVFNLNKEHALENIIFGHNEGTLVSRRKQ